MLIHPTRQSVIWVARHEAQEVGTGLARKILKDAGIHR